MIDTEREILEAAASDAREQAERLAAHALIRGTTVRARPVVPADAVDEGARLQTDLQGQVSLYARAMRQLGAPPERVVVLVRKLADDAAIRAHDDVKYGVADHFELRDAVVTWAIGSYYDQ